MKKQGGRKKREGGRRKRKKRKEERGNRKEEGQRDVSKRIDRYCAPFDIVIVWAGGEARAVNGCAARSVKQSDG